MRAAGAERLIVTTDCTCAAGLPPGTYEVLGMTAVLEPDGLLHSPEKKCLVGSSATMVHCMNVVFRLGLLGMEDLMRLGFYNPLALLRIPPHSIPTGQTSIGYSPEKGFACRLATNLESPPPAEQEQTRG